MSGCVLVQKAYQSSSEYHNPPGNPGDDKHYEGEDKSHPKSRIPRCLHEVPYVEYDSDEEIQKGYRI